MGKIIQPISDDLTASNPARHEPNAQPNATTTTNPVPAQSSSMASQPVNNPAPQSAPSSIYPEATTGANAPIHQNPTINPDHAKGNSEDSYTTKLIIVVVMLFGAIIAIPALLGLVGGVKLISFGYVNSGSAFVDTIDVIYLAIGAGLILRKELARIAFVVIAVIGLCLSIYGTFHYSKYLSAQKSTNLFYQQEIKQYQSDTYYSATQRAQIIKELQSKEKATDSLLPIIETYAISILPLLFLTRPSVKEVFG